MIKSEVLSLYQKSFEDYISVIRSGYCDPDLTEIEETVYSWVCETVCEIYPYDSALSEKAGKELVSVLDTILSRTTYDISISNIYYSYALFVNMLHKRGWVEWGSSIRNCWFEEREDSKEIIDGVPFSKENIKTLLEFVYSKLIK